MYVAISLHKQHIDHLGDISPFTQSVDNKLTNILACHLPYVTSPKFTCLCPFYTLCSKKIACLLCHIHVRTFCYSSKNLSFTSPIEWPFSKDIRAIKYACTTRYTVAWNGASSCCINSSAWASHTTGQQNIQGRILPSIVVVYEIFCTLHDCRNLMCMIDSLMFN